MYGPWWAMLTVWGVVNAVDLLQAAGYLARIRLGGNRGMAVNHALGVAIALLSVPATIALVGFVNSGSTRILVAGPAVFDAFVVLMVAVDYVRRIEWRSPRRTGIFVPYLTLFFASIFLMGLPMFSVDRRLWLVTAATAIMLVGSMAWAMRRGVG